MTTKDIIQLSIIAGLLFWLFMRSEPENPTYELHYTEKTVDPVPVSFNIPVNSPVQIIPGEPVRPSSDIPDSLIRAQYDLIAALYDSLNKVRTYTEPLEDTNATGTISATVRGELLKWDLKYDIKPITIRDTFKIETKPPRFELYGSARLQSDFQPSVGLIGTKGRYLIGVDYAPLNQRIGLVAGVRLFRVR